MIEWENRAVSQPLPQYTKEWLSNEQVLCYRFQNLTIITVDSWSEDLITEFSNWPSDRPWRLMLDIRLRGGIVSAYALHRSREISRLRPELPGRLAVLVDNRLAADVINIAIRTNNNAYRSRAVFVSESLAIHWLVNETA